MENMYTAEYGSDKQYYVDGRGNGLGYHSGYLNPELRFGDNKDIKVGINICEGTSTKKRMMVVTTSFISDMEYNCDERINLKL